RRARARGDGGGLPRGGAQTPRPLAGPGTPPPVPPRGGTTLFAGPRRRNPAPSLRGAAPAGGLTCLMKLLCLLPYALDLAPGQRYRIEQWLGPIRAAGVQVELAPMLTREEQQLLHTGASPLRKVQVLASSLQRGRRSIPQPGEYDAVWPYRSALLALPPFVERRLARTGIPILYDFDDSIWLTDTSAANERWAFLKCAGKTAELCRMAAAVVVGNDWLAEYARKHNANVHVIPS